ncbi:MAG: hypothetical protein ACKV1O_22300 [Saprospiraceae bacterium]
MEARKLSFSDLVETAVKLNVQDFENFVHAVNTRRAQQRSDVLTQEESDLLKKIYQPFPKSKKERIAYLNTKIKEETLTASEHTELIDLVNVQEKWAATRMERLAKLAILRNTDYDTLMLQLGLAQI